MMDSRCFLGGFSIEFSFKDKQATANFASGVLRVSSDETLGIRPFQLLVSSVVTCSGFVYQRILEKQQIVIDDFTIHAEVERDEAGKHKIAKIRLTFKVTGNNLNEKKLQRNVQIARKNCSMIRSIEDSIEVIETLEIIKSS